MLFPVLELGEGGPYPHVRSVSGDVGGGLRVEDVQVQLLHAHILKSRKGFLAGGRPVERDVLAGEGPEGLGHSGEIGKEILIEIDHPEGSQDFLDIGRGLCFSDRAKVVQMRLNPILGNDVAGGRDGGLGEGALAHLQMEIVCSEGGQGSPQIPIMGLLAPKTILTLNQPRTPFVSVPS